MGPFQLSSQDVSRAAIERRAIKVGDVAEHSRHGVVATGLERKNLERRRVGSGNDVGLLHAAEAVDRRAVEGHPFVERILEFRRRNGEALGNAEDVGEPHLDELHAALFDGLQHVLTLAFPTEALFVVRLRAATRARLGCTSLAGVTAGQQNAP